MCRPISVVFDAARRGLKTDQVERGQVVAAPRSIKTRSKLAAEVYVLGKDEGGRHTPIFGGYKPQFHVRTTDVTGVVSLATGVEMVMPGDNACIEVALANPIKLEVGSRFAVREAAPSARAW